MDFICNFTDDKSSFTCTKNTVENFSNDNDKQDFLVKIPNEIVENMNGNTVENFKTHGIDCGWVWNGKRHVWRGDCPPPPPPKPICYICRARCNPGEKSCLNSNNNCICVNPSDYQ